MKSVYFYFNTKTQELEIIIGDEKLIISEWIKDTNFNYKTTLTFRAQEMLIKKLVNNISLY